MSDILCSGMTSIMITCTDVQTFSTVSKMPNSAKARFLNNKKSENMI